MDLTDEQWRLLQPLLPPPRPAGGRGRPALDPRRLLNGILWKLRFHVPWSEIPSRYGSHQACHLYYARWTKSGLLQQITRTLADDLKTRGRFDFEQAIKSGLVRIEKLGSRHLVYFPFPFSETWQASTSMLFYQPVLQTLESKRRLKSRLSL